MHGQWWTWQCNRHLLMRICHQAFLEAPSRIQDGLLIPTYRMSNSIMQRFKTLETLLEDWETIYPIGGVPFNKKHKEGPEVEPSVVQ
jgi:hypothetical protein